MRRWRHEQGQLGVEYAGLLALLAVVFVAMFAVGLDQKLSTAVRQAVCTILGGEGCGQQSPPEAAPYEDSGLADREIFDAECDDSWDDDPVREGDDGESGNEDVDQAYANLGRVYDYYYDRFDLDSLDGDGATILGVVNFCDPPGRRGGSSVWDGDQIKFAPGAADSLDTAAHELTHAVIDNTADLEYQCQSGALNEAIADMMAYNIDPEDTTYGENRDGGAIRDYADPTLHGQPAHVDDYDARENDGTTITDYGGVHHNSGIPNHAYYELVQRVGRDRAEQILWRALSEKLESDSGFEDFRTAMLESARELYGDGIEVEGVDGAFASVGLDGTWSVEQDGC